MRSRRAAAVPPNLVYETPCVVVVAVVVGRFITIIIIFSLVALRILARHYLARSLSICLSVSRSLTPYSLLTLCVSLFLSILFFSVGRYFTFSVYTFFSHIVVGFLLLGC